MTALAHFAILSHGWQRALLLIVAGAVAALSAAPLFWLPALFLAMPVLVWTLDGAERREGWRRWFGPAFFAGFWFGLGYFVVSLHWLGAAFFVDGGYLVALMPLAILALSAVLSVFWGLGTALAHMVWSASGSRILILAAALSLAEFARGHLFTGFPFNLLGYALTANPEMMQASALVGVYGLTLAAILVSATPALIWPGAGRSLVSRLVPFFLAVGLVAGQIAFGAARIASTEIVPREDMIMRLVQPAIPQDLKWQFEARGDIIDRLIDLSTARTAPEATDPQTLTHIVWPEAALPFFISEEPDLLARIARALPQDALLLTGAPREPYTAEEARRVGTTPFNSILAIDASGEVVSSYDKTHLVPFGEYLPIGDFFARFGIRQIVEGSEGWAPGAARRVLDLPGTPPFLPLICYEIVYPGGLGAPLDAAEFILVVTNDAWFDGTIGPAQHFHHARLRAVEEGKPLVRVANSGVTAFIDPLGRITGRLAEGEVAVLDGAPSHPLAATLFGRHGHAIFFALWAATLVIGLGLRWRARRQGDFG